MIFEREINNDHSNDDRVTGEYSSLENLENGSDTFLENSDVKISSRQRLENLYFAREVCNAVEMDAEDDLYEAGFDADFIDQIKTIVRALPLDDRKRILSYPAEIRKTLFLRWAEMVKEDFANPESMVEFLLTNAKKYHWSIGYHLSDKDIKPEIDHMSGDIKRWEIIGYEEDHRNNDLPMAYYSMDYMSRYRGKGRSRFLYVVRAILTEDSDNPAGRHFMDYENKWGRAARLSVVCKLDMHAIEEKVARDVEKTLNNRG